MRNKFSLNILIIIIVLNCQLSIAQWTSDTYVNTIVSDAPGDQNTPLCVSDGAGGAIMAWCDSRSGGFDIYAQRINNLGIVQWLSDVAICTTSGDIYSLVMTSDGMGGAIIAWDDPRNGSIFNKDIYAQRIDGSGNLLWTVDGVAITSDAIDDFIQSLIFDGSGGTIITWKKYGLGSFNIYAQYLNASGVPQWTIGGISVGTSTTSSSSMIVSDYAGGAIIVWEDDRNTSLTDLYVQRINSSGVPQWAANGIALCTAAGYQEIPSIITDGSGGAIICWLDERAGANAQIYIQRVNSSGTMLWATDGIPVYSNGYSQLFPVMIPDGSGGVIISWGDNRHGSTYDIYAQKINLSGTPQWTASGVPVCEASNEQYYPVIASDSTGGAIIAWHDFRSGVESDIYVLKISASGDVSGALNGQIISSASGMQSYPKITADGNGEAIVIWGDYRNSGSDVYAQHTVNLIFTGSKESDIEDRFKVYPNPATGYFIIKSKSEGKFLLMDKLGQTIANEILKAGENKFEHKELSEGIYFLDISSDNKKESIKIVINK